MKTLLLTLTVAFAAGMCSVSCRSSKSVDHIGAGPAYEFGSAEFVEHSPPQFHELRLGLAEEAVLEAVGKPNNIGSLLPLGQMGKPAVGKRYTYNLNGRGGIVWVDFDKSMHVTGIFWRDRD